MGFDHEIPICGRVTAGRRDFVGFERLRGWDFGITLQPFRPLPLLRFGIAIECCDSIRAAAGECSAIHGLDEHG